MKANLVSGGVPRYNTEQDRHGFCVDRPYISVREQEMNSDRNKSRRLFLILTNERITSRGGEDSTRLN